jgi:single-strand DNA-binding protein
MTEMDVSKQAQKEGIELPVTLTAPLVQRLVPNSFLNSILIEGNMVREPEYRETVKGTPLSTFTIASSRFYKHDNTLEQEVSYFDVEAWAKLAENCERNGHKGRGVRVVGRIKQNIWNDASGNAHSKVIIVAEHLEFRPEFTSAVPRQTEPVKQNLTSPPVCSRILAYRN